MVTARSIPPGDSGELEVKFSGKGRIGHQEKTVTILTNDPEARKILLTVKAFVNTEFGLQPQVARLGRFNWREGATTVVDLIRKDPGAVRVEKITSSSPLVSGTVKAAAAAGETSRSSSIEVSCLPGAPLGKLKEKLTIHSSSQKVPVLVLPVSGLVVGDIVLEPPAITFRGVKVGRGKDPETAVTVRSTGDEPFTITGVEDTTGQLAYTIEEVEQGLAYRLTVTIRDVEGVQVPDRFNGTLQIATDSPLQPMLELPVFFTRGKEAGFLNGMDGRVPSQGARTGHAPSGGPGS